MTAHRVPLVDLAQQQRRQIDDTIREGFNRVIADSSFVLGPQVREFEEAWAKYCGTQFAGGVGKGTAAIELALRATGVKPGDEVLVATNTFVATAGAVMRAGAKLVLADCNTDYLVAPESVAEKLTPRTKAVIGLHLFGQAARIDLLRLATNADVTLVEAMAQAHGARRFDAHAGTLGDVAATSFYPGKHLGAHGNAGVVMTSSASTADQIRKLRHHGETNSYEHSDIGFNSRMNTLQTVVLSAKLSLLDQWNQKRAEAAELCATLRGGLDDVVVPATAPGNEHVFHLYVVRVPGRDRDHSVARLNASGVGAGLHYRPPIHLLPAYEFLGHRRDPSPRQRNMHSKYCPFPSTQESRRPGRKSSQSNCARRWRSEKNEK